jgi:hypothetical protein
MKALSSEVWRGGSGFAQSANPEKDDAQGIVGVRSSHAAGGAGAIAEPRKARSPRSGDAPVKFEIFEKFRVSG